MQNKPIKWQRIAIQPSRLLQKLARVQRTNTSSMHKLPLVPQTICIQYSVCKLHMMMHLDFSQGVHVHGRLAVNLMMFGGTIRQ